MFLQKKVFSFIVGVPGSDFKNYDVLTDGQALISIWSLRGQFEKIPCRENTGGFHPQEGTTSNGHEA